MAKFCGKVGYGDTVKVSPGVWRDVIVEKTYYGDIIDNSRQLREGENLNDDISVSNSISILADPVLIEHFFAIRYVEWYGARWKVNNVTVQRPRLLLRLGEVYNGPTAS